MVSGVSISGQSEVNLESSRPTVAAAAGGGDELRQTTTPDRRIIAVSRISTETARCRCNCH